MESIEKELEKELRAVEALESVGFSRREAAGDLRRFDDVWNEMSPSEREQITRLLVEGVEYDGVSGSVKIDFRETVNG